ncbi:unnamed protein product [Miscanthus lutarioriparius]|uniref:Uncharacterized protein n=1 Tax=Miscanthus lutarioriparius TaxID=422564 RepID=A0A811SLH6_9POAL|nr:unnamed protein product [Miscanthus lutarioriparius]
MIEQFVNFVIRPPRAEYNPDQYLWEPEFTLAGRRYKRLDLEAMDAEQMQMKPLSYFFLQISLFLHLTLPDQGYQVEIMSALVGMSLLYGAEDPSIAGMVLDSAFANLYDLMMELVEVYKIRVPKFTVKMAVQYMRRVIQRRAKFDIMDLNVVQFAPKTFIPALFGHASNDMFIQPHHTERIHQAYAFPSTCTNKFDKYYNLGAFKGGAGTNESLLYEIINGLRAAGTDAGSSSAATANFTNATKSVVELLTERVNQLSVKNDNDLDFLLDENHNPTEMDGNTGECHLEDKANRQTEECCSYTSSNRESWGRCSSLGGASDGSSSGEQPEIPNHKLKSMTLRALATPLRRVRRKPLPLTIPKEKKNQSLWKRNSLMVHRQNLRCDLELLTFSANHAVYIG